MCHPATAGAATERYARKRIAASTGGLRVVYIHRVFRRNTMRMLPVILLTISSPMFAAEPISLIGNWKLVSWQVIAENEAPQNVFGSNPNGYLVLTREGRSIVVTTADNRKAGMGDNGRAAVPRSLIADGGKYAV